MEKKCIFKLKPHKNQMQMVFGPFVIGIIVLLIGVLSLFGEESKVFKLSISIFSIFIFISIALLDRLESYEVYDDLIVVKNGSRVVNSVYIKNIKVVKIKYLSTNAKYAESDKLKSFVFCDGRDEINNTLKHPGTFDYFLNNSKVCVRIYYNEELENYLKSKNIPIE